MHLRTMSQRISSLNRRDAILEVVKGIKMGSTLSYKEVAVQSGYPANARLVGYLMATNYDKSVPCHRVIKTNREVGEYNRGKDRKISLLLKEGVSIVCMPNGAYVVQ